MKKKDVAILIFAAGLLVILGGLFIAPTRQQAPDVSLTTLEGNTLSLRSLRGKPVLIDFWATTCSSCIQEMPQLIQFYNDYKDRGVKVIGVAMSYDPPNQVLNMRNQKQIPYTIALDIKGDISRAFGEVRLTPTHFLIDPNGHIVLNKIGTLDFAALRKQIDAMLADATQQTAQLESGIN